jgi:hypothetical protein
VKFPALSYWCIGFGRLVEYPSPKYQRYEVTHPIDWSENCTESGICPVSGVALKSAWRPSALTGTSAAVKRSRAERRRISTLLDLEWCMIDHLKSVHSQPCRVGTIGLIGKCPSLFVSNAYKCHLYICPFIFGDDKPFLYFDAGISQSGH